MLPDLGGADHLVILGLVALLVFKPQDLPVIMKKAGQFLASARKMAADFRASFEDMARQSELDQLRKEVEAMKAKALEVTASPMGGLADTFTSVADDMHAGVFGDPMSSGLDSGPGADSPPPVAKPRKTRAKPAAAAPDEPAAAPITAKRVRKSPSK